MAESAMKQSSASADRRHQQVGEVATDSQQAHLRELIDRYTARTPTSKRITQLHRKVLADPKGNLSLRASTKEMTYPIYGRSTRGSRMEDIDGNQYVEFTMGFGALIFGHEPDFVNDAIKAHLSDGLRFSPRTVESGEVA